MRKGIVAAFACVVGLVCVFALCVWPALSPAQASPQTFENLGQAGIGLLIAYSVSMAAGGRILSLRSTHDPHEEWLGFAVGLGICALVGIGLGFGMAEHRRAGYGNWIDWLGLWWTVASIGLLGILVALQPFLDREWRRLPQRHRWRTERLRRGRLPSRARGA